MFGLTRKYPGRRNTAGTRRRSVQGARGLRNANAEAVRTTSRATGPQPESGEKVVSVRAWVAVIGVSWVGDSEMLSSRYSGREDVFRPQAMESFKPMADKALRVMVGSRMRAVLSFLAIPVCLETPVQLRGAWITADDLERLATRKGIATALETLADAGFNAVFPPMRARVDPADRDVLAEILFEAHRQGLEVLPRLEAGAAKIGRAHV